MSAFIAWYAWSHRATRGSQIFAAFMACMSIYVLGYSMELSSLDLPTMLFWNKVGYIGITIFPPLFFIFTLQYTGQDEWLRPWNTALLFLIPAIILISKLFEESLHLVYSQAWVDSSGIIPLLAFTRGPLYPLGLYNGLAVGAGVLLLWLKRTSMPPLYRNQATMLVISAILPLLTFLVYMGGFQPISSLKYLDINTFMYTLWGVGLGWAMYRYRLFQLAPIAREALVEGLSDGIFVFDDQARLADANPVAIKIMGWPQAPIGQGVGQAFATWKELKLAYQASKVSGTVKCEIQRVQRGQKLFFDLTLTPLQDAMGHRMGQLVVIHDITQRKQLEENLRELTLVDELTGLNNRRGFHVLATQFLHMAKRMNSNAAVIFADLDNMKSINDGFGHAEGDQALVDIARLFQSVARSSDILARLGGDEFVALAIENNEQTAVGMLDRLTCCLEQLNDQPDRKYRISISFGVAHYDPQQSSTLDELLNRADKAMYEHKQIKKEQRAKAA